MRIAVLRPQVPFARGGAEIFTDELVAELRSRGHEADLVSVPFKWYPGARVLTQAFLWRMLDLEEADGRKIDVVVATKFPSYVVRHREKRVWLVHQFRQAYELDGTELGQFGPSAEERALRRQVQELDRSALSEAKRLFATSANVAGRLERSTGLVAEVLPHPPQALPYRSAASEGFVLSASRLDRAKRIDLLLEAAALRDGFDVVIASDGPDRDRLEEVAHARGLDGRVRFEGRVSAERARGAVCDLLVRVLRAGGRGLRHGAVRGVPLRQARDHDDGRRRPARRRARPPDGDRGQPRARRDRRGRSLAT